MKLMLALGLVLCQVQGVWATDPAAEVRDAERGFAKSMADRDLEAFGGFIAEDAVFLTEKGSLRGRAAVIEGWKGYFVEKLAPFSWEPRDVEVLSSGALAISRGPVFDPQGRRVGTFISTWRREGDGRWLIVLDAGCPPCPGTTEP